MKTLLLSLAVLAHGADWNPLSELNFNGARRATTQARPPSAGAPRARTPQQLDLEPQWIALDLGLSDDATLEADPAAVAAIKAGLADLRARYPEAAAVGPSPYLGRLILMPDDAAGRKLAAAAAGRGQADVPALGLADVDAVLAPLGAKLSVTAFGKDAAMVTISFAKPVDARKLADKLKKLPGVNTVAPDMLMGGSAGYSAKKDGGEIRLSFWRGSGDCMAGCINTETWFFTLNNGQAAWKGYAKRGYNGATNAYELLAIEPAP